MKFLISTLVGLCFSSAVLANGSISAKVLEIRVDADGRGMVVFEQPVGGTPPSCVHQAYLNAFAFNASGSGGKAVMALAISAKTTGATISVYGAGACGIYNGAHVEDWSYGVMR